jgi:hypothetical protein
MSESQQLSKVEMRARIHRSWQALVDAVNSLTDPAHAGGGSPALPPCSPGLNAKYTETVLIYD